MRKCCWEVFVLELLVVIWIAHRQVCWLAWGNLSLRPLSFPFFSFCWFLLLLAQLVSLGFFGENWIVALVKPLFDPCIGNKATNLL